MCEEKSLLHGHMPAQHAMVQPVAVLGPLLYEDLDRGTLDLLPCGGHLCILLEPSHPVLTLQLLLLLLLQGVLRWLRSRHLTVNLRPLAEMQMLAFSMLALCMLWYTLKAIFSLLLFLLHTGFGGSQASTSLVPLDHQQELAHIEQQLSSFPTSR